MSVDIDVAKGYPKSHEFPINVLAWRLAQAVATLSDTGLGLSCLPKRVFRSGKI